MSRVGDVYDFPDPPWSQFINHAFQELYPESNIISPVHKKGEIVFFENSNYLTELVFDVVALFDTGAIGGSYISKTYVDNNPTLQPLLIYKPTTIYLADNKTSVTIDHVIPLHVRFADSTGNLYSAQVVFRVLPTCSTQMIIGLPHLISSFSTLLTDMMNCGLNSLLKQQDIANILDKTLLDPWSNDVREEAPEDLNTPLPTAFGDVLHFLEVPYDQAVSEYLSALHDGKQVQTDFLQHPGVKQLLSTLGSKVFVPSNWEGINGIDPFEVKTRDNIPDSIKARSRQINPKLWQHAKKEFERMRTYFYKESDSNYASPLVIAPKATAPFIRLCGDHREVNKYIMVGQYRIPILDQELEKIQKFKVFLDLDLKNAFHQIRLGEYTSRLLSIVTPWGQFQPKFMPEGVGPASAQLQRVMESIFADMADFSIVLFDNILVMAMDFDDALLKLERVFKRCIERNLFLKFSKSFMGFKEANFFGYVIKEGCCELSQQRKDAIQNIPLPQTKKQLQSFLGASLFFRTFVPRYSMLTAALNDMLKDDFDWRAPLLWKDVYKDAFLRLKAAINEAQSKYYPDYNLEWILRTDASDVGVGATLVMVQPNSDGTVTELPIGHASQKFSDAATRWSVVEKEAYGNYFGIKAFDYLLQCKPFILETDHQNLLWIETSQVAKIIRWRIYMQGFNFKVRHIPGKQNKIADLLSRMHSIHELYDDDISYGDMLNMILPCIQADSQLLDPCYCCSSICQLTAIQPISSHSNYSDELHPIYSVTPTTLLEKVHGGRHGHLGVRYTYRELNRQFPGHQIPIAFVMDYVSNCPICQKSRLAMVDKLEPITRHLVPSHIRAVVGADILTVTPPDEAGNQYLVVIVDHYLKFVQIYPTKSKDAISVATCLFTYYCNFGKFDALLSDPGSEFTADVCQHLHKWLGMDQQFSIVDRHTSNGVEATNREILRHLKALIYDERVLHQWSSPTILPIITYIINSTFSSEAGIIPMEGKFGTHNKTYHTLSQNTDPSHIGHKFIQLLDKNLKDIYTISKEYQALKVKERTKDNPGQYQNTYQPGDFVLMEYNKELPLPTKLTPPWSGPYKVIKHVKNDVHCKDLITGRADLIFDVTRLKPFIGSSQDAYKMAMLDNNQFFIDKILAHRGDPWTRSKMDFYVQFTDGSKVWLPYSIDISATVQFGDYIHSTPSLYPLRFTSQASKQERARINRLPITEVEPGDLVYVDLRCYQYEWFNSLQLPNSDTITYLLIYRYTKWSNNSRTRISAICELLDEQHDNLDHMFILQYGSLKVSTAQISAASHFVITKEFLCAHPTIIQSDRRKRLLKAYLSHR